MKTKYYYTRKEVSQWLRENKLLNHNEIDEILLKVKNEKWYPRLEEKYYCVDSAGDVVKDKMLSHCVDSWRTKTGNCFKTEKEAKVYRQKLINLGREKIVVKGSNGEKQKHCKGGAGGRLVISMDELTT